MRESIWSLWSIFPAWSAIFVRDAASSLRSYCVDGGKSGLCKSGLCFEHLPATLVGLRWFRYASKGLSHPLARSAIEPSRPRNSCYTTLKAFVMTTPTHVMLTLLTAFHSNLQGQGYLSPSIRTTCSQTNCAQAWAQTPMTRRLPGAPHPQLGWGPPKGFQACRPCKRTHCPLPTHRKTIGTHIYTHENINIQRLPHLHFVS